MTHGLTLYIAGPMTGLPNYNFAAFDAARNLLFDLDHTPISPADHDREAGLVTEAVDGTVTTTADFSLEKALRWDFTAICRADGIALLPGWWQSNGACKEARVGLDVGARFFEVDPDERRFESIDTIEVEHLMRLLDSDVLASPTAEDWTPAPEKQRESPDHAVGLGDDIVTPPLRSGDAVKLSDTMAEVRVVDPETGGVKGQKLARFDLLPGDFLWALAEHFGRGAMKYADRNWERGYAWSLSFAACQRHLWAFWNGEDIDPETGTPHVIAAGWHCAAMYRFLTQYPDKDDRPKAAT